jgi:hypothetical protein
MHEQDPSKMGQFHDIGIITPASQGSWLTKARQYEAAPSGLGTTAVARFPGAEIMP